MFEDVIITASVHFATISYMLLYHYLRICCYFAFYKIFSLMKTQVAFHLVTYAISTVKHLRQGQIQAL